MKYFCYQGSKFWKRNDSLSSKKIQLVRWPLGAWSRNAEVSVALAFCERHEEALIDIFKKFQNEQQPPPLSEHGLFAKKHLSFIVNGSFMTTSRIRISKYHDEQVRLGDLPWQPQLKKAPQAKAG